jgi:hypothetical protein
MRHFSCKSQFANAPNRYRLWFFFPRFCLCTAPADGNQQLHR